MMALQTLCPQRERLFCPKVQDRLLQARGVTPWLYPEQLAQRPEILRAPPQKSLGDLDSSKQARESQFFLLLLRPFPRSFACS